MWEVPHHQGWITDIVRGRGTSKGFTRLPDESGHARNEERAWIVVNPPARIVSHRAFVRSSMDPEMDGLHGGDVAGNAATTTSRKGGVAAPICRSVGAITVVHTQGGGIDEYRRQEQQSGVWWSNFVLLRLHPSPMVLEMDPTHLDEDVSETRIRSKNSYMSTRTNCPSPTV